MGHWVTGQIWTVDGSGVGSGGLLAHLQTFAPTGQKADVERGALFPYTKSAQVYLCPSNLDGIAKDLTYSMNCAIAGIPDAAIEESASIVLLMDEEQANDGFWYAVDTDGSTDTLTSIHNGGGNVLLFDGHVKFYRSRRFPPATTACPALIIRSKRD